MSDLDTERHVLKVCENQFHRFPFSIPTLNALLNQASVIESLESQIDTVEVTSLNEIIETPSPKITSREYYRSRDKKHHAPHRRGGF